MKITPYGPTVDAPGPAQAEFISQAPGPVSLGVVAQTGSELRQAGTEVIRRERYVADLKLHEEQINQALQGKLSATMKLDAAEDKIRDGEVDPDTQEVITPPATGTNYAPQVAEQWKDIRTKTVEAADPGVRPYLDRMLWQTEIERMHQARNYGNTLWRHEQVASVEAYRQTAVRLASDPSRPQAERDDIASTFLAAISMKQNVLTATGVEKMREAFETDRAKSEANGEIDRTGTYERKNYEGRLNDLTLDMLDRHAESVANKRNAKINRDTADLRRQGYADLMDFVVSNRNREQPATLMEMQRDPRWSLLEGSEMRVLADMVERPKIGPSDPATRRQVMQAVDQDRPTMSIDQIWKIANTKDANGVNLLNDADTQLFTNVVKGRNDYWRGFNQANVHRAEDKALQELERRQREASTIGIGALTLTGDIGQRLEHTMNDYQTAYREAMFRRSKGSGLPVAGLPRDEIPEDVMYDVLPDLMRKLAGDAAADYEKQQRIVDVSRYKTAEQFKKAYPTYNANDPEFMRQLKVFQGLEDSKRQYDALQLRLQKLREENAARKK